jgi:hypothetical protein
MRHFLKILESEVVATAAMGDGRWLGRRETGYLSPDGRFGPRAWHYLFRVERLRCGFCFR